MYHVGGIAEGTEMMSYENIGGKLTHKLETGTSHVYGHKMVSLCNLFGNYEIRFAPVWYAIHCQSRNNIRLLFEDGFEVVCSQYQKFFMSNKTWKMAKDLTPEDKFLQVFRDPKAYEFRGDYCSDDGDFEEVYVPDDLPKIKLKSSELLPSSKLMALAMPVDFQKDTAILANGAVIETICILDEPLVVPEGVTTVL